MVNMFKEGDMMVNLFENDEFLPPETLHDLGRLTGLTMKTDKKFEEKENTGDNSKCIHTK